MKKLKYSFFIILLIAFSFVNIKSINALSKKEAVNKVNNYIVGAIKDNTWKVSNSETDKDFYDIKIFIGNINNDSNLKEAINGVAYLSSTDHKSYKSTVLLFGCKNADKCDDEHNFEYNIHFRLKNDDSGNIFLYTDYFVTKDEYNGMKKAKKVLYTITTNRKGLEGNIVKEGSYSQSVNINEDEIDKTEGRSGNPKLISENETITIPEKDDSFWNDSGLNKCYYIKFNFSKFKFARYIIEDKNAAGSNIFINSTDLTKNIVEDCKDGGVFGISKDNVYAICNSFGKTYTFKYKDSTELNTCTDKQKKDAESQNGEGTTKLLTKEEQEQIIKDNKEKYKEDNGNWDPNKLCDNGNCNVDITKFCNEPQVARTLKFLGLLLAIAKVLVPALIIGLGFVDLAKIVISGKMDEAKKQGVNIIKRVVIGVVIFLIPTILITIYNVAYSIANDSEAVTSGELNVPTNFKNCVGCILDANNKEACIVNTN